MLKYARYAVKDGKKKILCSKNFKLKTKRLSQPKHSVKKQAKFEKVVKSTVQPSYVRQE